jgi:hypothetical protein
MKRRPGILLLFFGVIAVTALSSNVSYENLELLSGHNTLYPDSSNSMKWLRADSVSLELLPPSSGIRFYRDGIVYLSSSRFEEKMIPDHLSFGQPDARYSPLHGDTIGNPLIFSPTRVFPFPCDGITFSKDFKSMYFTKYARDSGV